MKRNVSNAFLTLTILPCFPQVLIDLSVFEFKEELNCLWVNFVTKPEPCMVTTGQDLTASICDRYSRLLADLVRNDHDT